MFSRSVIEIRVPLGDRLPLVELPLELDQQLRGRSVASVGQCLEMHSIGSPQQVVAQPASVLGTVRQPYGVNGAIPTVEPEAEHHGGLRVQSADALQRAQGSAGAVGDLVNFVGHGLVLLVAKLQRLSQIGFARLRVQGMHGTVPWWAVTLLGWVFVLGGLGWYFLPDHRPPLHHDAKIRNTFNGLFVGGIGLVLVVTSLFISPWWALLVYAGVIGSATVIRLQIRRHANDLKTFLSETTADPVP